MADVSVAGGGAPEPVLHGQTVVYTFTVANAGPDGADGVGLTFPLPADVSYVSALPSQGSCGAAAGTVTCALGTLAAAGSATVTIDASAATVGAATATATVTATPADPVAGNDQVAVTTTVAAAADLGLTALGGAPDPALQGSDVTYTIQAHNAGPDTASAATIVDTLDGTMTFVSASAGCSANGATVTCNLGDVASGADAMVQIVATANGAGMIANGATVSSTVADPSVANNSATTTTTVDPTYLLSVSVAGTGTVSSAPGGIDGCTASCGARYAPGTVVSLTATGVNGSGQRFNGWSGRCSGRDRNGCSVTMNGPRTVGASFVPIANNLVFISSVPVAANLGGATAYDTECNQLATAAGLNDAGGTAYVAWVSQPGSNAIDRLGSAQGFIRVDGAPFSGTKAELAGGKVMNAPDLDENGVYVNAAEVWTGTFGDGTADPAGACMSWNTTSTNFDAVTGTSTWGPFFTNTGSEQCNFSLPIYCVGKSMTNALAFTPVAGKKIFLASWTPGSGIAGANKACDTGVTGAVALLPRFSPMARSAASLLQAGTSYVRPDGVLVGTGAQLVSGNLPSGIWQLADGSYETQDFRVITGSASIGTVPSSNATTCADWTVATGTATTGWDQTTTSNWWSAGGLQTCNNATIICVEP
jgi:uncharacterized repeat protein (TIGR01451 family)